MAKEGQYLCFGKLWFTAKVSFELPDLTSEFGRSQVSWTAEVSAYYHAWCVELNFEGTTWFVGLNGITYDSAQSYLDRHIAGFQGINMVVENQGSDGGRVETEFPPTPDEVFGETFVEPNRIDLFRNLYPSGPSSFPGKLEIDGQTYKILGSCDCANPYHPYDDHFPGEGQGKVPHTLLPGGGSTPPDPSSKEGLQGDLAGQGQQDVSNFVNYPKASSYHENNNTKGCYSVIKRVFTINGSEFLSAAESDSLFYGGIEGQSDATESVKAKVVSSVNDLGESLIKRGKWSCNSHGAK